MLDFDDDLWLCDGETNNASSLTFHSSGHEFSGLVDRTSRAESDGVEDVQDMDLEGLEESQSTRSRAIQGLEDMVLDFLGQLAEGTPKSSSQDSQRANIKLDLADRRKPVGDDGEVPMRTLTFPQKSKNGTAKTFAQVFRTVDLMHEALLSHTPTTKRDMFYKDVNLFGSQATLNKIVDDVAATIGVSRGDLNVRASMKGLICGSGLTLVLRGGIQVPIHPTESTLIPPVEEIERFDVGDDLSWVLVVEKEAVFQTLCHTNFACHPRLRGTGLVLTGKGYPDLATRQLISTLSNNLPSSVPFVGVVDCDPHGIDILSVYKYGSHSMSHEREMLIAPRLDWAGLQSEDLSCLNVSKDCLVPITKHDERKALSMLRRENLPQEWKKELQNMLHGRRKAEIEILSSHGSSVPGSEDSLTSYLVEKIIAAQEACSLDEE